MSSKMDNKCRTCGENSSIESFYPEAHFNKKVFKYYKCTHCLSFNVFPTPDKSDFEEMYGESDHTYLKELKGNIQYDFNYPFAHHQGYQIEFLDQIKKDIKGKELLDYACGSGFYMKYAQQLGAKVTGVEFDMNFVKLLKEKSGFDIYTFDELKTQFNSKRVTNLFPSSIFIMCTIFF